MIKIAIATSSFAQEDKRPLMVLKSRKYKLVHNTTGKRLLKEDIIQLLKGCDGVVAGLEVYDQNVLNALPQLRCISRCGVGVDNIDLKWTNKNKVTILNTPQVVIQPVAELTVAMIFDLLRNITVHARLMQQRQWKKIIGRNVIGRTIGIVGLGRIGRRVAELLSHFEVKIVGCDVDADQRWLKKYNVTLLTLHQLLKICDVVTIHVGMSSKPLLLTAKHFKRMKKGSSLINTSRGVVVDEEALYSALQSGHLHGAGLDVFTEEPYVGPLCELPNVILTPHIATLTQESRADMEIEAVNNLVRFFKR